MLDVLDVLLDVIKVVIHNKLDRQDRAQLISLVVDLRFLDLVQPLLKLIYVVDAHSFPYSGAWLLKSLKVLNEDLYKVEEFVLAFFPSLLGWSLIFCFFNLFVTEVVKFLDAFHWRTGNRFFEKTVRLWSFFVTMGFRMSKTA